MSGRRGRTTVLGALAIGAVVAGCGSSSSGSKAEEGKTPTQVLADSKSALSLAKAVHVSGTISDSDGAEQLDLQLQDQATSGSITEDGTTLQLVNVDSTVYFNAPAAFWTKTVGAQGAALAGKWIKVSSDEAGDAAQLTLPGLSAQINADDSPLTGKTTKTTLDGKKALLLTQQDGSQLYVADSSSPVPLKLVNKGDSQGTLTFTDYGAVKSITAPPGAIDADQAAAAASATPTA